MVESLKVRNKSEEQEANDDLMRLFPTMVCGDVQDIKNIINDSRHLYKAKREQHLKTLVLPILHRLKKQGGLFGYPLVSDVASHFEQVIQKSSDFSLSQLTIMQHDALLLQEILWKKIHGDGGEKGRKILNQLVRIPR